MEKSDKLIYSKRYIEPDSDWIRECMDESNVSVDALIKSVQKTKKRRIASKKSIPNEDLLTKMLSETVYVPDINRSTRVKEFIEKAKKFSEQYHISTDIYEKPSMVSVWILFETDVLSGEKKHDFVWLLDFADELTGIPYPESMRDWCDEAVILNYMTHHCFVNGRELHPFN